MTPKLTKLAAIAAGALLAVGAAAVAASAADPTASPSASSSSSTVTSGGTVTTNEGTPTDGTTTDRSPSDRPARGDGTDDCGPGGGKGGPGGTHTEVTGDEATKVTDAVTAWDSGYTVTSVQKDDDGSYDVHATKADGTTVMLEVSADLTTIEEHVRGDR